MAKDGGKLWMELLGTPEQFEKVVLAALTKQFNSAVQRSVEVIQDQVKELVYPAIFSCREMEALRGDDLRVELGLTTTQASGASARIAQTITNSVVVNSRRPSGKDFGGINLHIQPSDYANVLNVPGTSITYRSKAQKQTITLEWLDWLINRGDEIIVAKFGFEPAGGKGRSGGGKMKKGGSWRVSPQYAGTADDNFITRALQDKSFTELTSKIIEKTIKKHWK
tara:strand:+ start:749 stop:1420 length:672 start_codon:yes stop_codon:yes gene_type:complete